MKDSSAKSMKVTVLNEKSEQIAEMDRKIPQLQSEKRTNERMHIITKQISELNSNDVNTVLLPMSPNAFPEGITELNELLFRV